MSGFYVYTCWDENRRPLYVGQTNDIKRRMREHGGYSRWPERVCFMSVIPAATRREARDIEAHQIKKLRPANNVQYNPRYDTVASAIAQHEWHEEYYRLNGWLFAGMPRRRWFALTDDQREAYYTEWDCALHDSTDDARGPGGSPIVVTPEADTSQPPTAAVLSGADGTDGPTPCRPSRLGVAS